MSVFGPRPVDRRPAGCRKYKPAATRGGGDGGAGVKPWRYSFTYYVNSLEFRSRVCLLPGAVVRTRAAQQRIRVDSFAVYIRAVWKDCDDGRRKYEFASIHRARTR